MYIRLNYKHLEPWKFFVVQKIKGQSKEWRKYTEPWSGWSSLSPMKVSRLAIPKKIWGFIHFCV